MNEAIASGGCRDRKAFVIFLILILLLLSD